MKDKKERRREEKIGEGKEEWRVESGDGILSIKSSGAQAGGNEPLSKRVTMPQVREQRKVWDDQGLTGK